LSAATLSIPRTLIVTGHFPPEAGGVQTFTSELVRRLPADRIVVVAPKWPGDQEFDAAQPFPVIRRAHYLLFRGLRRIVHRHQLTAGWITSMAPFGLYAPFIKFAGIQHLVASSHGAEIAWARIPVARPFMRSMVWPVDTVTYLNNTTLQWLKPVLPRGVDLVQLAGGVDASRFTGAADGAAVRARHGLGNGPVVITVARLVRRKGHDELLTAWRQVAALHPNARLLIVGEGPTKRNLEARIAAEHPDSVVLTGPVSHEQLASYYRAADVFVLPCRDAGGGLQSEGLGLSTLEASASGLPVIVGRSGGSIESVQDGRTGILIEAEAPAKIASAILTLLADTSLAASMGRAGSEWVREEWGWDLAASRLASALGGGVSLQPAEVGRNGGVG
jgi:phosphatidylinositol alpha-1,6-mannosyltransferase